VIRKIDQRGTIFNKFSQICAYAGDVVLITRTKQKLTQMYEHLETEARKTGLLVNENVWFSSWKHERTPKLADRK
jgi:predicted O-methyltransferase YrrM